MLRNDIRQMDYAQLRQTAYQLNEELEELKDEFSRWKRELSDRLENLDESNFSAHIKKQRDKMMAQLTITPEQIRSAVCKGIDYSNVEKLEKSPNESKAGELDEDKIYLYGDKYYYYDRILNKWQEVIGDMVYSVFEQTADGFELKGNVTIDGKVVKLRNIEFEAKTELKQQYSADGSNWYDTYNSGSDLYMRISTDDGVTWSTPFQITGKDTTVTPDMIFNALTDNEAKKGLFSVFDGSNGTKLYINADYIKSGTISGSFIKGGTVSGTNFKDTDGITTLVLGYISPSDTQYANLKLVRNDSGLMLFGIQDNSAQSGSNSASILIGGKSIGWGDGNAFNPYGTWNFHYETATIEQAKIVGAKIYNGTELHFTGDNAKVYFTGAQVVDFTNAKVNGLEGHYVFSE